MKRWILTGVVVCLMLATRPMSMAAAAGLTHGPIVGHTTDHSTRIWVRADGHAELQVRLRSGNGQQFLSGAVVLEQEDNFCGAADVEGLTPDTTYSYRVLLDGREQRPRYEQSVTTFPPANRPTRVRVGFGHSVRGPGEQTTWLAIADKKPDLFILMGDNIYSNTTEPIRHRRMYLQARADPCFAAFAARTPVYAIWDDHDYGADNSDRTQPGRERSLKTFNEIWPNPPSQARRTPGIWTRFTVGQAEFFLLDVRYHRSPDDDPDGPDKTMLGAEQRDWLLRSLPESRAVFKFLVSGSSWNCGGVEAWNHRFLHEYDTILRSLRRDRIAGVVLLGGDQHECKIAVRPAESWGGYDLHEWMAGQIWNREHEKPHRGFGLITVDTTASPPKAELEFFDQHGRARAGHRVLYTPPGALRAMWNSPPGAVANAPRAVDGELRPTSGPLWDALPSAPGETLTIRQLVFEGR